MFGGFHAVGLRVNKDTTSLGDYPTNEPVGMTNVVNRNFNSKASNDSDRGTGSFPDKTGGSEGWDGTEWDEPNFTIVADGSAPGSTGSVGRITYPVGLAAANGPCVIQTLEGFSNYGISNPEELYVRAWIRLSPDYFTGAVSNKLWFHRMNSDPRGEPYVRLIDNGSGGFRMELNMQGTQDNDIDGDGSGTNDGTWYCTGEAADMQVSTWYQIETYFKVNSAVGVADGVGKIWLNGSLVLDKNDLRIKHATNAASLYWMNVHFSPTYGGGPNPNDTEFWFDIDRVYVSVRA